MQFPTIAPYCLSGDRVALCGTLFYKGELFPRQVVEEYVTMHGGIVHRSKKFTSTLDYIIFGQDLSEDQLAGVQKLLGADFTHASSDADSEVQVLSSPNVVASNLAGFFSVAQTLKTRAHVALPPSMMPKEESTRRTRKKKSYKQPTDVAALNTDGKGSVPSARHINRIEDSRVEEDHSTKDVSMTDSNGSTIYESAGQHHDGCDTGGAGRTDGPGARDAGADPSSISTSSFQPHALKSIGPVGHACKATEDANNITGSQGAGTGVSGGEAGNTSAQIPKVIASEECGYCHESARHRNLLRCARCQTVWYCGRQCQRNHYAFHKYTCLQRAKPVLHQRSASTTDALVLSDPFWDSFFCGQKA